MEANEMYSEHPKESDIQAAWMAEAEEAETDDSTMQSPSIATAIVPGTFCLHQELLYFSIVHDYSD